jgi:hypothetical protein
MNKVNKMKALTRCIYCVIVTVLGFVVNGNSQMFIAGPKCVTQGVSYLYDIHGKWDSSAMANLCVEGGLLTDYGLNCVKGVEFSYAKIKWNNNIKTGKITLNCIGGMVSADIKIVGPFDPGKIDSLLKLQVVDSITTPNNILCSVSSGGSCSPQFSYQWQQSIDDMTWQDIEGAINKDLKIGKKISKNVYYRRKNIELSGKTITYSDEAMVLLSGK